MDALVVGLLTSLTVVAAALYWELRVRPEGMLALFASTDGEEQTDWFDTHPGSLRVLRWVAAALVFLFGFLTGFAITFLSGTA